ncbi:HalOD1 output domain-containing protein [Natrinema salinisoli]|uniref:HalOD1 output domain-containing protein n=1 Tax=Natrinema salinisoli TaxID=2878535 RepID=UPI001CF0145D|nr:HalOD1 output domain-containing protein [Natrinema salinisoli]
MREPIDATGEDVVLQRQLDADQGNQMVQLVELIADIDDVEPTEISPIYRDIDSLVSNFFGSQPPSRGDATLAFSYQGYRIHLKQDGRTTVCDLST